VVESIRCLMLVRGTMDLTKSNMHANIAEVLRQKVDVWRQVEMCVFSLDYVCLPGLSFCLTRVLNKIQQCLRNDREVAQLVSAWEALKGLLLVSAEHRSLLLLVRH
jgi:hypothetical protein